VTVEPIALRLDATNARGLVAQFDVVLDGSDNFETRYALSDACYWERRPLVAAALGAFDGTLTVVKPYEIGQDGRPNPTYRCLFPDPPEPGTIPTCAEAGILGAIGGVLGSLMALEAIREIVGGLRRRRRGARRAVADDRSQGDALRDATLPLGRDQSAERSRGTNRRQRADAYSAHCAIRAATKEEPKQSVCDLNGVQRRFSVG